MKRMTCLALIAISLHAHARDTGTSTSGGGYAVVCRDASGVINSATLLDLVEAVQRYNLSLPQATGSLEADYNRALANRYRLQGLKEIDLGNESLGDLQKFFTKVQFKDTPLISLNDMGQVVADLGNCKLEPVAVFHDDIDQVEINLEIYNKLDSLSQAALVCHENYYHYERGLNETTSEGARLLVAHVFSNSNLPAVDADMPAKHLVCVTAGTSGQDSEFYAYKIENRGETVLQLRSIMGRTVITKATVSLQDGFLTALANSSQPQLSPEARNMTARAPVSGDYAQEWDIEAVYSVGQPVLIRLYEKGIKVAEAPVTGCAASN